MCYLFLYGSRERACIQLIKSRQNCKSDAKGLAYFFFFLIFYFVLLTLEQTNKKETLFF